MRRLIFLVFIMLRTCFLLFIEVLMQTPLEIALLCINILMEIFIMFGTIILRHILSNKSILNNLKRFISEHTRWKNKINEISSKKKIFKIIKRKLSVASNSSDERRNFTVRMAKTGVLKKSNLLDKIKLNTSVRFRDKDQCKFNKIAY